MSLAAVLRNVKADPLAFVQSRKPRTLDVTDMDKHVLPAVGLNEAEAFLFVEPFHFACWHSRCPFDLRFETDLHKPADGFGAGDVPLFGPAVDLASERTREAKAVHPINARRRSASLFTFN